MRPHDFGHEYFAIYLKFVLQKKLCVHHLCSLRNLSFSEDNAEKRVEGPTLLNSLEPPMHQIFAAGYISRKKT